MGRTRQTIGFSLCAGWLGWAAAVASGRSDWVTFADETALRLNPSIPVNDTFGKHDVEEKDYAWGDVDQDGDIDLVVVRKDIGSNAIGKVNRLFMNENGALVDRTSLYANAATDGGSGFDDVTADRDVALVDVDGDGWLDIVTASAGANIYTGGGGPKTITHPRIYINLTNDGGGNWLGFRYEEARIPTLTQIPNFCGIAFGDVDTLITAGGPPDLYFTDYTNGLEDRILVNNGSGSFTDLTSTRFSGNGDFLDSIFAPHAVMADLNGDGYNDIVKNSVGPYQMKIVYNDPGNPGTFTTANSDNCICVGLCGCNDYFVAVADLNNDGLLDIVEVDDGSDRWFRNTGNGGDGMADFVPHTFPDTNGFGSNVVIADLDKDGFKDVLIADVDVDLPSCNNNRLKVQHNTGGPVGGVVGFAEDTGNLPTGVPGPLRGTHDIAVFDIDGDTWPDLVIGTCTGTTIWINQPATIAFSYPSPLPTEAALDGSTEVQVELNVVVGTLEPGSPTMFVSSGGRFSAIAMTDTGGNVFSANLPGGECLVQLSFYFTAELTAGSTFNDPPTAPSTTFEAVIADGIEVAFLDQIEGGVSGWTVVNDPSLTAGAWEQADPNGTIFSGNEAAPEDDATPGPGNVQAFVTDNGLPGGAVGANDVDGGPTRLISPAVDLDGSDGRISYARWFFSEGVADDSLTIEVSNNGTTWVLVETVTTTNSAWETASFIVSNYVVPSATVQVRFSTSDNPNNSITEAGIDDFQVDAYICPADCPTDVNGDGSTNVLDLIDLLLCFGLPATPPCDTGQDVNGDGVTNVLDLIDLLLAFGTSCP